ncbi:DNA mismatch repair protein MutL [Moorella sp. E308F]|uniref:DNA mismatch repair endonuclease MutL n=1 Tax=Moorella sp. E308F TaxID=2572682 RepID=UPI0010FFB8E6|nr:DNA mismatch repair endonuclease MutL [Moorella sp. E308F]GEA15317.1 DNA mismatch repair protein MutL [Moorella sp. E308F]
MTGELCPRIAILDAETANQIAAGEVVERPASVVKELVENSLDAAARHIAIEVKGGGLTLIRVRDDGWGINPEDAPLAFARHATSKIRRANDLWGITTLGFRGEALPSIAAVARVEMDTRPPGETAGVRVRIAGGGEPEITAIGCPPGTTVTVTDLFYNTPARRQYLKKPASEARAVVAAVERLALAHPEVAFNLHLEGKRLLSTPGNSDLQAVVAAIYGLETGRELLPLAGEGEGWTLKGFISPPWLHRAGRSQQVLTVNGRYIFNRLLTRAVEECYQAVIPSGRHPLFILQLTIDPRLVDVNVHPAKLEVRFQQEYELARQIAALVNRALHTPRAVAPATTAAAQVTTGRLEGRKTAAPGALQQDFAFQRKEVQARFWGEYILKERPADEENRAEKVGEVRAVKPDKEIDTRSDLQTEPVDANSQVLPPLRAIGQLLNTYILAEGMDGLYIIDQHAAHERCRFESLQQRVNSGSWPAQMLEPPLTLHLAPAMTVKLVEQIVTLRELGFIVETFGANSFLLRSVPSGVPPGKEREVLEDFLADENLPAEERLLKILSCHGAIKAGDTLSGVEMQKLLDELQKISRPYTCPHGRPAVVRLDRSTLARYFHRPQGAAALRMP